MRNQTIKAAVFNNTKINWIGTLNYILLGDVLAINEITAHLLVEVGETNISFCLDEVFSALHSCLIINDIGVTGLLLIEPISLKVQLMLFFEIINSFIYPLSPKLVPVIVGWGSESHTLVRVLLLREVRNQHIRLWQNHVLWLGMHCRLICKFVLCFCYTHHQTMFEVIRLFLHVYITRSLTVPTLRPKFVTFIYHEAIFVGWVYVIREEVTNRWVFQVCAVLKLEASLLVVVLHL